MTSLYAGFHDDLMPSRNVGREIQQAGHTLRSLEVDWEERVTATSNLVQLAKETDSATFMLELTGIKDQLSLQLKDLRSSVIKAVCANVTAMAEYLQEQFQPMAEYLLPFLMKLLLVSKIVMSDSGHRCIESLLRNCRGLRFFDMVLPYMKEKNATSRTRATSYVSIIVMEVLTPSHIKRLKAPILEALRTGLEDAAKEARTIAGTLYWFLSGQFAKETARILEGLPSIRQKLILKMKDENTASNENAAGAAAPAKSAKAKPAKRKSVRPKRSGLADFIKNKRKQTKTASTTSASTGSVVEIVAAQPAAEGRKPKLRPTASEPAVYAKASAQAPASPQKPSAPQMFSHFPALSSKPVSRRRASMRRASISRGAVTTSAPSVVVAPVMQSPSAPAPVVASKPRVSPNTQLKKPKFSVAAVTAAGKEKESTPSPKMSSPTPASPVSEAVVAVSSPLAAKVDPKTLRGIAKIEYALEQAETQATSEEWPVREEAFSSLRYAFGDVTMEEEETQLTGDVLARIVSLYAKHIRKDTYHVVEAALQSFTTGMACFGAAAWTSCFDATSLTADEGAFTSGLFSAILLQSRAPRASVKATASRTLREVLGLFPAGQLFTLVTTALPTLQKSLADQSGANALSEEQKDARSDLLAMLRAALGLAQDLIAGAEAVDQLESYESFVNVLLQASILENAGAKSAACASLAALSAKSQPKFSALYRSLPEDKQEMVMLLVPGCEILDEVEVEEEKEGEREAGAADEDQEGDEADSMEAEVEESPETTAETTDASENGLAGDDKEREEAGVNAEDVILILESGSFDDAAAALKPLREVTDALKDHKSDEHDAEWFQLFPRALAGLVSVLKHQAGDCVTSKEKASICAVQIEAVEAVVTLFAIFPNLVATLVPLADLSGSLFSATCSQDYELSKMSRNCLTALCLKLAGDEEQAKILCTEIAPTDCAEGQASMRAARALRLLDSVIDQLAPSEATTWLPLVSPSCVASSVASNSETRMAALKCLATAVRKVPEQADALTSQLSGYQRKLLKRML